MIEEKSDSNKVAAGGGFDGGGGGTYDEKPVSSCSFLVARCPKN
jgi:hypothetical protein